MRTRIKVSQLYTNNTAIHCLLSCLERNVSELTNGYTAPDSYVSFTQAFISPNWKTHVYIDLDYEIRDGRDARDARDDDAYSAAQKISWLLWRVLNREKQLRPYKIGNYIWTKVIGTSSTHPMPQECKTPKNCCNANATDRLDSKSELAALTTRLFERWTVKIKTSSRECIEHGLYRVEVRGLPNDISLSALKSFLFSSSIQLPWITWIEPHINSFNERLLTLEFQDYKHAELAYFKLHRMTFGDFAPRPLDCLLLPASLCLTERACAGERNNSGAGSAAAAAGGALDMPKLRRERYPRTPEPDDNTTTITGASAAATATATAGVSNVAPTAPRNRWKSLTIV